MLSDEHRVDVNDATTVTTTTSSSSTVDRLYPPQDQHEEKAEHCIHPESPDCINNNNEEEKTIPQEFICPITLQVMVHPLTTRTGLSFERSAILDWLECYETCPLTRQPLRACDLIRNVPLEARIGFWRQAQQGLEETKQANIRTAAAKHKVQCLHDEEEERYEETDKIVAILPLQKGENGKYINFTATRSSRLPSTTSLHSIMQTSSRVHQIRELQRPVSQPASTCNFFPTSTGITIPTISSSTVSSVSDDDDDDDEYATSDELEVEAPISTLWRSVVHSNNNSLYAKQPGERHRVFLERILAAANAELA